MLLGSPLRVLNSFGSVKVRRRPSIPWNGGTVEPASSEASPLCDAANLYSLGRYHRMGHLGWRNLGWRTRYNGGNGSSPG
jgi:hypothetical protein